MSRLLYVGATIAHAIEREEETEVAIAAIPPQAMRVLAIDAETLQSQVEGFKALVNEVAEML